MYSKSILFYAGSLRPGGGLTVAHLLIESLAKNSKTKICVYTGASDSSDSLKPLFEKYSNVTEKRFFPNSQPSVRYLASKIYFLISTLFSRNHLLISINYYIPSLCKLMVYHLNLLSFLSTPNDTLSKKIKEFDAHLACRWATVNVFESDYLMKTAKEYTGLDIENPKRLYINVDQEFFTVAESAGGWTTHRRPNLLAVTSVAPHKDNETCIRALHLLIQDYPDTPWMLTIVGGQSLSQWDSLRQFAKQKGIEDNVTFLGPISKIELAQLMHESLCVVLTSLVESFCMVAIESMAAGCPTIVTNATSMPESVGDAAMLVDESSPTQFAEAIVTLHSNSKRRCKLVEFGFVHAEKFSHSKFSTQIRKLLYEL